ncbi:MAG TPA: SRPBCC domain-containing protein [Sphingomicrobium sp.]|nr:SRPBCC domain-containing protein [Sphingomicrobium sp.]
MTEAPAATKVVERIGSDTIRLERLLDAPPETVWRYLTEAKLREQWFMGGTDAAAGGGFDLIVDHDKLSSDRVPYPDSYECFKGRVFKEKVLRFDPPKVLETTFQGGDNGVVTYELHAEGAKTRMVLTHSKIQSPSGFQDFGGGWNSHLAVLQQKLVGATVRNFWELHQRSREEVASALR